jgi:thiamine-monophosphate kinase
VRRKSSPPADENRLIQLLQRRNAAEGRILVKGIGDDTAVIRPKGTHEFWLITTDMLVENIDFRREWYTPRQLGRKSISVNLSDLAAMGARPRFYTVSLAVPRGISERWMLEFHEGLADRGNPAGAQLIGGDLSRSEEHIAISITALGESLNSKVVYRSGGKAGDLVYVTGCLGRSAAGLHLLQNGTRRAGSRFQRMALQAHQDPEARCAAGLWLAQSGFVRSMMDLSDGLSMDLPRLCAAGGVGADILISSLPVFQESARWGCDPVELALHGGEDYELLFTIPSSKKAQLEKRYPDSLPPVTKIGRLSADAGRIGLIQPDKTRVPIPRRGFDHFAEAACLKHTN